MPLEINIEVALVVFSKLLIHGTNHKLNSIFLIIFLKSLHVLPEMSSSQLKYFVHSGNIFEAKKV